MQQVRLIVHPARAPLYGSVPVPTDARIVSRAVLMAALANGSSTVAGFADTSEQRTLIEALRALGATVRIDGPLLAIDGVGLHGLRASDAAIDCGPFRSILYMLAGLLSAQPFSSRLDGKAPARGLEPLLKLLRSRGARIMTRDGELPWHIEPTSERLLPVELTMSGTDPDLKSALLISGLYAAGPTTLLEHVVAEDHLERLLDAMRVPVHGLGAALSLHPPAEPDKIDGFDIDVPGDISLAAFLMAAGSLVQNSTITMRKTSLNPSRAAIVDVLRLFGGRLGITPHGDTFGEPVGEITVHGAPLRAGSLSGEPSLRVWRDLSVVCILATRASGITELTDLVGTPADEENGAAEMVELLRAFGVEAEAEPGAIRIVGRPQAPLRAAELDVRGRPDIALAATVLGLVADAPSRIERAECIVERFPRFIGTLRALGARLEVER